MENEWDVPLDDQDGREEELESGEGLEGGEEGAEIPWRRGMRELYLNGINADESPENADWVKRTWDFPDSIQSAEEFRKVLKGLLIDPEHFKELPVYKFNVDKIPWLKDL